MVPIDHSRLNTKRDDDYLSTGGYLIDQSYWERYMPSPSLYPSRIKSDFDGTLSLHTLYHLAYFG